MMMIDNNNNSNNSNKFLFINVLSQQRRGHNEPAQHTNTNNKRQLTGCTRNTDITNKRDTEVINLDII